MSDINIDNPAKFRDHSMPRTYISKNRVFQNFGLEFIGQTSYVKSFLYFMLIYVQQLVCKSGKNFIVIPIEIP